MKYVFNKKPLLNTKRHSRLNKNECSILFNLMSFYGYILGLFYISAEKNNFLMKLVMEPRHLFYVYSIPSKINLDISSKDIWQFKHYLFWFLLSWNTWSLSCFIVLPFDFWLKWQVLFFSQIFKQAFSIQAVSENENWEN